MSFLGMVFPPAPKFYAAQPIRRTWSTCHVIALFECAPIDKYNTIDYRLRMQYTQTILAPPTMAVHYRVIYSCHYCVCLSVFFRAFRGESSPSKFPTSPPNNFYQVTINIQTQKQHFVISKIAQDPLGVAAIQYVCFVILT